MIISLDDTMTITAKPPCEDPSAQPEGLSCPHHGDPVCPSRSWLAPGALHDGGPREGAQSWSGNLDQWPWTQNSEHFFSGPVQGACGGARGWGSACARGPAENQTGTRLHGGTQRVLHDVFPSRPEKVAPDSKRGTRDLKSRQDAPCPGPPPGLSGVERVGLPEPEPRKADQTEMGPESPSWEVQLGQMAPSGKVPQSQCC